MKATVGLDIGTSAVRAALLQSGKRGVPTLTRYGEVALPMGAVDGGEIIDAVIVEDAIRRADLVDFVDDLGRSRSREGEAQGGRERQGEASKAGGTRRGGGLHGLDLGSGADV